MIADMLIHINFTDEANQTVKAVRYPALLSQTCDSPSPSLL